MTKIKICAVTILFAAYFLSASKMMHVLAVHRAKLTVRNKDATREEVLSAMKTLPSDFGDTQFWAAIANDDSYPVYHRSACIRRLLGSYVHAGMSVKEVARILDSPTWLKKDTTYKITSVDGFIPVDFDFNNSIFQFLVFADNPQDTVDFYLKVDGDVISTDALLYVLRTGHGFGDVEDLENRNLLQMAFSLNDQYILDEIERSHSTP